MKDERRKMKDKKLKEEPRQEPGLMYKMV